MVIVILTIDHIYHQLDHDDDYKLHPVVTDKQFTDMCEAILYDEYEVRIDGYHPKRNISNHKLYNQLKRELHIVGQSIQTFRRDFNIDPLVNVSLYKDAIYVTLMQHKNDMLPYKHLYLKS